MDPMEGEALVPAGAQQASCPLLELLSLDQVLLIADWLPPASLLVLSQTCRALRVVFWHRFYHDDTPRPRGGDDAYSLESGIALWVQDSLRPRSVALAPGNAAVTTIRSILHLIQRLGARSPLRPIEVPELSLSRKQRLSFLACLARDRPDDWVCDICVKFHRVADADNPRSGLWSLPWCLFPSISTPVIAPGIRFRNTDSAYHLYHRHIQMALKYARLGAAGHQDAQGARGRHLERLLAPCKEYRYDELSRIVVRYSVCPRIVGGRFLLAGEWHCYQTGQDSPGATHFTVPCLHQRYRPRDWSHVGPAEGPRDGLRRAIRELSTSSNRAEVRGACGRCPTDFSIQGSPGHTAISYWQDFGPEGSPGASIWTSQLDNGPVYKHEPGSIRELYESAESEQSEASSLAESTSG